MNHDARQVGCVYRISSKTRLRTSKENGGSHHTAPVVDGGGIGRDRGSRKSGRHRIGRGKPSLVPTFPNCEPSGNSSARRSSQKKDGIRVPAVSHCVGPNKLHRLQSIRGRIPKSRELGGISGSVGRSPQSIINGKGLKSA